MLCTDVQYCTPNCRALIVTSATEYSNPAEALTALCVFMYEQIWLQRLAKTLLDVRLG